MAPRDVTYCVLTQQRPANCRSREQSSHTRSSTGADVQTTPCRLALDMWRPCRCRKRILQSLWQVVSTPRGW